MFPYKSSGYNFFFPYSASDAAHNTVAYNARTGALALMEPDKYEAFCQFAQNGTPIEDEELLNNLLLGGYLVTEDTDELLLLRHNMLQSRYYSGGLSLTIAPTADCNFRCIYCYEKDALHPDVLSVENQARLIEFVKNRIQTIHWFSVTWYGGEPLLALPIVESLSKAFMELCQEHDVKYRAGIVTNGYLLTPSVAEKLEACKVDFIQITVDGAAEDHDQRRFLRGGQPTFHRIMENLCAVRDITTARIDIRINADKHNLDRVDNVVHILREKGPLDRVHPYLAMVYNAHDNYNDNNCLRSNEFSIHEFDFNIRNNLPVKNRLPMQLGNFCGADQNNSFVIGADGSFYKCWDDIGRKECVVGTLEEGVKRNPLLLSYMLYDPTEDPECKTCKYLPLCMGGCPHFRREGSSQRCIQMKHGLESYMSVIPALLAKARSRKPQN